MSRDLTLFLYDIEDRCRRIQSLVQGIDYDRFVRDDAIHESVLRHLTIIGEAVKNLPDSWREREPNVPWRKIARLRDLLVHVYFGIQDEVI